MTAYYGFWWEYGVPPSKIPWKSITHLVHFVGGSNTNGTSPYFSVPREYEVGANEIRYQDSLIQAGHQYGVRVLLDLGLNTNGGFNQLCALGEGAIRMWAHTVKSYMLGKGYDGVDIDLEPVPGPAQREQWGTMLHILRDTLNTVSPKPLLTCAVMQFYSENFNPDSLSRLCDQINLMEYDQAGSWNSGSGHNSPLYKNPDVPGGDDSSGIMSWLENNGSIPSSKFGFGMALYGRLYSGVSQANQTPNNNYQYRWYNDIVTKDIPSYGAKVLWDDVAKVPSVSDPNQNHWVTFDDTNSLKLKVAFARRHNLGGVMLFGIGEGFLIDPPPGRDANELAIAVGHAAGVSYSALPPAAKPEKKQSKSDVRSRDLSGAATAKHEDKSARFHGPDAGAFEMIFSEDEEYSAAGPGADDGDNDSPRQSVARTAASNATSYWNTVHYANWEHGDLPPSKIPWQYITNLIHFAGNTLGAQTNGNYPYWQAPSNWEIDNSFPSYSHIGDSLRANGARYGVIIEIDAGFNSSNQFYNLCVKGDTAIATWAGQVGRYMVNWHYGGIDFDLEGGSYPPNYGFQKMVKFLHDTLAVLSPGKKYYFTASVMPNTGDQTGWGVIGGPNPAMNILDQINPMFYDVSGTFGSPLYKNASCSTWGSDSAVALSFVGIGIPATKVGLGYNIQVYHTSSTTACPPGGFGYISKLMNEINYFPPAAGATIYWDDIAKEPYMINTTAGVKIAYEDTVSTYYKGDFIRRRGLGGAMGFCLGRGYLPNPPSGVRKNMAVEGMGLALNGLGSPPPPPSMASVSGRVFLDADSSGIIDSSEFGLANWTISLQRISPDTVVYTDVSDGTGKFSFTQLPAGTYRLSKSLQPLNGDTSIHWTHTYPSAQPYVLVLAADSTAVGLDFGNFAPGVVPLSLVGGWNLISTPVEVAHPAVKSVFSDIIGSAFAYYGQLSISDTIKRGVGYWLRYPADQAVILAGSPILHDTIAVNPGWNLIGALSKPLAVSSIVMNPNGNLDSRFFSFTRGYAFADTLWPGLGYWVKCLSTGTFALISSGSAKVTAARGVDDMSAMSSLTFTTIEGYRQSLYFSPDPKAVANRSLYEMPPAIDGVLDARFVSTGGGSMVWVPADGNDMTPSIVVRGAQPGMSIHWKLAAPVTLATLGFGQGTTVTMQGEGAVDAATLAREFPADGGPIVVTLGVNQAGVKPLPASFRVYQNYPNPFNPSTVIRFDLPERATINTAVYTLLGTRVLDLPAAAMEAGQQSVGFDGSQLATGVYYCRVTAMFGDGRSTTQTIRMMLVR